MWMLTVLENRGVELTTFVDWKEIQFSTFQSMNPAGSFFVRIHEQFIMNLIPILMNFSAKNVFQ